MDEQSIAVRLDELEAKIEKTYQSAEKTRKYILWTMIGSIVVFVLPIIGLAIAIPPLIRTYSEILAF